MSSNLHSIIATATRTLLRSTARSVPNGSQTSATTAVCVKSSVPSTVIRASSTSIALEPHQTFDHHLRRDAYQSPASILKTKMSCPFRSRSVEENHRPIKQYDEIPAPKGLPILGTTIDLIKSGGAAHIHEYADRRHKEMGPIFRENLGTIEAVFIADSNMMQSVYSNEGKYPMHFLPEPWVIYNQIRGIERGLFFM